MAIFKQIAVATMDAASNTSLTSAFYVASEFHQFMVRIPPASGWGITATCGISIQGAPAQTGTFYDVAYSNNPATSTSGHVVWSTAGSAAVSGANVICEALAFVPSVTDGVNVGGWAKIRFVNTATAATDFIIYGRKIA